MKASELKRIFEKDVFDIEGAADYLGVQPNSVEIAALRGRIPYVHFSRKKFFCKDDLDYYRLNRAAGRASRLQSIEVFEVKRKPTR